MKKYLAICLNSFQKFVDEGKINSLSWVEIWSGLLAFVKYLSSFELILVVYLLMGIQGQKEILGQLNLSNLFLMATIVSGLMAFRKDRAFQVRIHNKSLLIFLCLAVAFFVWMCVSTMWSSSEKYAGQKTIEYLTDILIPLIGVSTIVVPNQQRVERLVFCIFLASIVVCLLSVYPWIASGSLRYSHTPSVLGSTYYGVGRLAGFSVLIATVCVLCVNTRGNLLLWIAIWVLGLFIVSISGARSPFLGVIIGIVISILIPLRWGGGSIRQLTLRRVRVLLLICGILLLTIPIGLLFSNSYLASVSRVIARFEVLFQEPRGGSSAASRLDWYTFTFKGIVETPIMGHGIGSWPVDYGIGDRKHYPHNILLEIFYETGVLGILIVILMFQQFFSCANFHKLVVSTPKRIVFILCIYLLVNANFFGDLIDNRLLFVLMGLFVGLAIPKKTTLNPQIKQHFF